MGHAYLIEVGEAQQYFQTAPRIATQVDLVVEIPARPRDLLKEPGQDLVAEVAVQGKYLSPEIEAA
jgi:hypothetical protein